MIGREYPHNGLLIELRQNCRSEPDARSRVPLSGFRRICDFGTSGNCFPDFLL